MLRTAGRRQGMIRPGIRQGRRNISGGNKEGEGVLWACDPQGKQEPEATNKRRPERPQSQRSNNPAQSGTTHMHSLCGRSHL